MSAIATGSKASGSGGSAKNAFNVPQNQAERKHTVYYPYHRNEGYPRQMMSNFRLVKVATLKRYVRYYNVPVRPDSTPVELACAVAKHFKSELDVSGSVAGEKKVIEHFVEQVTEEQEGTGWVATDASVTDVNSKKRKRTAEPMASSCPMVRSSLAQKSLQRLTQSGYTRA